MNGLNYLLQSNLYLIIFYGFYWVLLRKETFNNFNRAYLVISGLISFAIPLWNLDLVQSWFITQNTTKFISQMNMPEYVISNTKVEKTFDITNYLSIIYGIGCAVLGLKLIMNIFNLYRYMYGITPISKAFSFFNNIFVADGLDPDDIIYDHERVHATQYHSFDVILFEIIGIFCWFNPVIYMYKTAIKNIHEFIADEIASAKLPSKLDYVMLLFSEQFHTHPSVLVSNFFSKTSLKLRVEMLNKKRSNKVALLKYGLIFPVFLGMLVFASVAIARGEKIEEILSFNRSIEGAVLNYDFKPIAGATVTIVNSNVGTTTDKNGMFKLRTNSLKTELVFSHISYKSKQLNVLNTEPIKVTMRRHTKELQGTVVLETQNEHLILPINNTVKTPELKVESNTYYYFAEKNAEYIGGTSELYYYLKSNLRYPKEAKLNKKEGVIYTQFMVDEKGEISNVKIVNPLGYMGFVGYGLEAEAKRVISQMPKWLPAMQNGEPVSSDFTLPVHFILDDEPTEKDDLGKKLSNVMANPKSIIFENGKEVSHIDAIKIIKKQYRGIGFKIHDAKEAFKKFGEKGKYGALEIEHGEESPIFIQDLKQDFPNEIFTVVDESAEFPGGKGAMSKYLSKNLKYPKPAQRALVEGTVFLTFNVKANGEIEDIQVVKGLGFGMDEEAIRVVKAMPNWKPAKMEGKVVNSKYNLPIAFKLK